MPFVHRVAARAHRQVASAALALVLALNACSPVFRDYTSGSRLGQVRVYGTGRAPAAVVFLFSDAVGWNEELDRAAAELADKGALVVGVDLRVYVGRLAASDDGCHYVVSEVEDLSKRIQRDLGFDAYRTPILAGVGQGATLAYAALAQSPAATVAGAIGLAPMPALQTRVALCPGAAATPDSSGAFRYGTIDRLPGWWRVSQPDDAATLPARLLALAADQLDQNAQRDRAEELPLVEYPVAGATVGLVFFSGDGGWRDLDKQIGEIVARGGIAVIGVDSLRYFWHAKPPERVAADLASVMRTYGERWGLSSFALAGYSFGADILPFAYNRLPDDARARVVQVSLLGIESTALFEFKLAGWFRDVRGQAVFPELRQLPVSIVQCFYGEEEEDTLCRAPEIAAAEVVRTTGSHHFDGNYAALADRILAGIARRQGQLARDHAP